MRLTPTLESTEASKARDAAMRAASEHKLAACIAIVDSAGVILELHRSDSAKAHTVDLATRKARTAALLGLDTIALERMVKAGQSLPSEVLAMAGGVAILHEGRCAGAVGVSGGASDIDHEIAKAGAEAALPAP